MHDYVAKLTTESLEEYKVEEQLQFLHAAFKSVHDSVVVCDREYTITYWNKASEQMYGIKSSEAVGKKLFDVIEIVETSPGENAKRFKKLETKGYYQQEQLHRAKHGEFWVSFSAQAIEDNGNRYGWVAIATDITERKCVEHDLQQRIKEIQCRYGIDDIFGKHWLTLDEIYGRILDILAAAWQYPKITCARISINGKEFKTQNYKGTKWRQSGDIKVWGVTAGVVEVYYLEKKPEVSERLFSKAERLLIDSVTQRLGRITERKQTEQELTKYQSHLEELVDERTAELTIANEKLSQEIAQRKRIEEELEKLYDKEKKSRHKIEGQMKQRVEFTRALVHELKTPLTVLLAASDLLTTHAKKEPFVMLAKNIQIGTLNLNRRVNELLDLAKSEIGMLQLKRRPVDLLKLLREMTQYVTSETSKKQQSLVARLPRSLPIIWGDEERLRQVVLNLLDNASKFTPAGGTITLKARQKDLNILVEVRDTGRGIDKEQLKRMFKPYHRLETDREQLSGLGLGLALCKTFIELHGSKIKVESQVGKGTTFSFSLPIENP